MKFMNFMRSILSSQFVKFSSKILFLERKDSTFTIISGHTSWILLGIYQTFNATLNRIFML